MYHKSIHHLMQKVLRRKGETVRSNSEDGLLPLLHIDDNVDDRFLVKEAIALTKTRFKLYEADSFEAAMPYFKSRQADLKTHPCPALVLLDYDLGQFTGADFLVWLRSVKKITSIPVVIFSGSVGEPCITECYANGANHFLAKPNELDRLKIIVHSLYLSFGVLNQPGPIALLQEYHPYHRETSY